MGKCYREREFAVEVLRDAKFIVTTITIILVSIHLVRIVSYRFKY